MNLIIKKNDYPLIFEIIFCITFIQILMIKLNYFSFIFSLFSNIFIILIFIFYFKKVRLFNKLAFNLNKLSKKFYNFFIWLLVIIYILVFIPLCQYSCRLKIIKI